MSLASDTSVSHLPLTQIHVDAREYKDVTTLGVDQPSFVHPSELLPILSIHGIDEVADRFLHVKHVKID